MYCNNYQRAQEYAQQTQEQDRRDREAEMYDPQLDQVDWSCILREDSTGVEYSARFIVKSHDGYSATAIIPLSCEIVRFTYDDDLDELIGEGKTGRVYFIAE